MADPPAEEKDAAPATTATGGMSKRLRGLAFMQRSRVRKGAKAKGPAAGVEKRSKSKEVPGAKRCFITYEGDPLPSGSTTGRRSFNLEHNSAGGKVVDVSWEDPNAGRNEDDKSPRYVHRPYLLFHLLVYTHACRTVSDVQ